MAGRTATFTGECIRCGRLVRRGDPIVRHRDTWIHVECASGQDDE